MNGNMPGGRDGAPPYPSDHGAYGGGGPPDMQQTMDLRGMQDFRDEPRGDMRDSRDEPRGDTRGDQYGDPRGNPRGDPRSNLRGDPQDDPRGAPRGGPRGGDPRDFPRDDPRDDPRGAPRGGPRGGDPRDDPRGGADLFGDSRGGQRGAQQPSRGSSNAWPGEGGLDEAFAPRSRAPNTFAPETNYNAARADQVLPARPSGPANIAQRYDQEEYDGDENAAQHPSTQRQTKAREAVREAAADWGGMSLGDTLVPNKRDERRGSNPGSDRYDRRPDTGNTANDYDRGGGADDYDRGGSNNDYDRDARGNDGRGGGNGGGDYDRRGDENDGRGGGNAYDGIDYDRPPGRDYGRQPSPEQFDERPSRKAPDRNDGAFGGGGGGRQPMSFDDEPPVQDFMAPAKKPARPQVIGGGGGVQNSPVSSNRNTFDMDFGDAPAVASRAPKSRAPPADDGWGGQSLGDAFAPKKAAPSGGGGGGSSGSRGGAPDPYAPKGRGGGGDTGECNKKTEEIVTWVRSLPESHVPENTRENLAGIIEENSFNGRQFTDWVQTVPPEICAPKHAMKLKSAWKNVLAEAAANEVARQNREIAASIPKAVALVC